MLTSLPRTHLLACALAVLSVTSGEANAQHRTLEPIARGSEQRVALVIGNANYPGADADLLNPTNDAEDMAEALRRLGFSVVLGTDLTRSGMLAAVREFGQRAQGARAALVFYAGHGVEIDGENYLLPTSLSSDVLRHEVEFEAVPLRRVLSTMEASGAPLKLVLLDACRNDPFRAWRSPNGGGWRSLGAAPEGTLIFYATAAESVASDNGARRNGLFTTALLHEIERPGAEALGVVRAVTRKVREDSRGSQVPWIEGSLLDEFRFSSASLDDPESTSIAEPRTRPTSTTPHRTRDDAPARIKDIARPAVLIAGGYHTSLDAYAYSGRLRLPLTVLNVQLLFQGGVTAYAGESDPDAPPPSLRAYPKR